MVSCQQNRNRNIPVHLPWWGDSTRLEIWGEQKLYSYFQLLCNDSEPFLGANHCKPASLFFSVLVCYHSFQNWPNKFKLACDTEGAASNFPCWYSFSPPIPYCAQKLCKNMQVLLAQPLAFLFWLFLATRWALQHESFLYLSYYCNSFSSLSLQVCPVNLRSWALRMKCRRGAKSPWPAPVQAANPPPVCAGTEETRSWKVRGALCLCVCVCVLWGQKLCVGRVSGCILACTHAGSVCVVRKRMGVVVCVWGCSCKDTP